MRWAQRYSSPKILLVIKKCFARENFSVHGVGIGVFIVQGFERRNKESKNTFRRFNNGKGNILLQNIRRLRDVFENNANNY